MASSESKTVETTDGLVTSATDTTLDAVDLPLALRRNKRRSAAMSSIKGTPSSDEHSGSIARTNVSSATKPGKKRVRFSDPGPSGTTISTGLTPHLRRTSLATPRRRASTPMRSSSLSDPGAVQVIQFTPIRQEMDDRTKRRIRRHRMSEEMNKYEVERKSKAVLERKLQEKDDELRELKEELDAARQSNPLEGHSEQQCASSQRIDEAEAELAALKESFNDAAFGDHEWIHNNWDEIDVEKEGMSAGPPSEGGDTIPIYEDDEMVTGMTSGSVEPTTNDHIEQLNQDAEILAMELDLETAKQEKRQLFKEVRSHLSPASDGRATSYSSNLQFADSPATSNQQSLDIFTSSLQSPPKTLYQDISKALKATKSRAEDAELALHVLEVELKTLGFAGNDSDEVMAEIQSHFRSARLELERIMPGETVSGLTENARLLPELLSKIKSLLNQLRDRDAEMRAMRDQQKTLKGNFDHSIVATEKANLRVSELEDAIETSAEEMLECRMRVQRFEKEAVENHKTIASLIAALEKYRADVTKMEQIMTELECAQPFQIQEATDAVRASMEQQVSDCQAKITAEQTERRAAESSACERLAKIKELEVGMASTQAHAMEVQEQLNALAAQKEEEELQLKKKMHEADEQHSAQLSALNTRISNLSTALASADAEVDKLTRIKSKLEHRIQVLQEVSQRTVEDMHQDSLRSAAKSSERKKGYLRGMKVVLANGEIEDEEESEAPMTPVSLVRFVDLEEEKGHVQGFVETQRGKKRHHSHGRLGKGRRRFDSGIGMDSLSERDEEEDGSLQDAALLPADAPSSEADVEML